jgi:hypothetical protein
VWYPPVVDGPVLILPSLVVDAWRLSVVVRQAGDGESSHVSGYRRTSFSERDVPHRIAPC